MPRQLNTIRYHGPATNSANPFIIPGRPWPLPPRATENGHFPYFALKNVRLPNQPEPCMAARDQFEGPPRKAMELNYCRRRKLEERTWGRRISSFGDISYLPLPVFGWPGLEKEKKRKDTMLKSFSCCLISGKSKKQAGV